MASGVAAAKFTTLGARHVDGTLLAEISAAVRELDHIQVAETDPITPARQLAFLSAICAGCLATLAVVVAVARLASRS